MRTNIEIDDELMAEALQLTGLKTKREVVEAALRLLVRHRRQRALLDMAGKIQWEGNLDAMREGRFLHDEQGIYRHDQELAEQSETVTRQPSSLLAPNPQNKAAAHGNHG